MESTGVMSPTAVRQPLPFFVKLLVGFLLVDGLAGVGRVLMNYLARESTGWRFNADEFWILLLGVFYLLLVPQVLLRLLAARISLTMIFALQVALFGAQYCVHDPAEWWGLSTAARLQGLGEVLFFTAAMVVLNRRPATDVLRS
ncbi:MAG: hypothetical protein ACKVX7_16785 [Planctomycetota bacterium]